MAIDCAHIEEYGSTSYVGLPYTTPIANTYFNALFLVTEADTLRSSFPQGCDFTILFTSSEASMVAICQIYKLRPLIMLTKTFYNGLSIMVMMTITV